MALLKARVSGSWVDTNQAGYYRAGGGWEEFGPAGGPILDALNWPNPVPATTAGDDTEFYHMGVQFNLIVPSGDCGGVQWYVPALPATPPGGYYATLFQLSPTVQLRKQLITPVPGNYQNFDWVDGPVTLDDDHPYVVGITTRGYSFRNAGGDWGFTNTSETIEAVIGKLIVGSDPDEVPASNFDSWYYISPRMVVA